MNQSKATEGAWNWLTRSSHVTMGHVKPAGEWLGLAREMAGFAMYRFQAQIMVSEFWKMSEHKVGFVLDIQALHTLSHPGTDVPGPLC